MSTTPDYLIEPPKLFLLGLGLFIGLICFRLVYSTPIEFNGESILKWHIGRTLWESHQWARLLASHHELRWSVVLPQVVVGILFPKDYASYYITPIVFFSAFTVSCIVFLRHEKSQTLLILFLICVISCDPMSHVMASQVNSGAFGLMYCSLGFIFLVRYVRDRRLLNIVLGAIFLFLAYAAHLTYFVFGISSLFFLLINKQDYRAVVVFLSTLVVLILGETVLMSLISSGETSVTGGRIERLWESKRGGSTMYKGKEAYQLHHFIDRWRMLPIYNRLIAIGFCLGGLGLLVARIRKLVPPGIWLCFYGAAFYGIAISFPVIGYDPIGQFSNDGKPTFRLALDLHSRYLALFFPLATVYLVWLTGLALREGTHKFRSTMLATLTIVLSGLFMAGSTSYRCLDEINSTKFLKETSLLKNSYCRVFRYSQEQNIYPSPDMFVFRANEYYQNFNQDYLGGKVAVYPGTRVGVFRDFMNVGSNRVPLVENSYGWYSVDGKPTEECILELGQVEDVGRNYRYCRNKYVSRALFD